MIRKRIENFFINSFNYFKFLYLITREIRRYGNYRFPYREKLKGKTIYLLANGPSLGQEIKELSKCASFLNSKKMVANYFCTSKLFVDLKPDYYCLADPIFFSGKMSPKQSELIASLNEKVSWPMSLFIPYLGEKLFKKLIKNDKISVIPISDMVFRGFDGLKYRNYKNGTGAPSFVNITIMMEYVVLNMGCKDIRLYGVDHTFFEGLTVDDNNVLCIIDKHFYGTDFRPLYKAGGDYYSTAEWMMDKYLTFKEHENMRGYADYLGAQIINCTKCSLIDAYVRESQLKKNKQ